jgi:hypothetical protein
VQNQLISKQKQKQSNALIQQLCTKLAKTAKNNQNKQLSKEANFC